MSVFQVSQDAKLREILKIYRRVETYHPIASEMFASRELERMFWNCLTHDLCVIRRRSQNLADGETTAVQKAFRVLMDEKADGMAAIEIYMDEILGLKIVPETDRAQTIALAIQTRDYILNRMCSTKPLIGLAGDSHTNMMALIHRVAGQEEPVIYRCLSGPTSPSKL